MYLHFISFSIIEALFTPELNRYSTFGDPGLSWCCSGMLSGFVFLVFPHLKNINMAGPERKLRQRSTQTERNLFDFDLEPEVFRNDELLAVVPKCLSQNLISFQAEAPAIPTGMKVQVVPKRPRSVKKHAKDTLPDCLYDIYHRRMEREETMMLNVDRDKIFTEADKMKTQLESLQNEDWRKAILSITKIQNLKDDAEMSRKRELTICAITKMLHRMTELKQREDYQRGRLARLTIDPEKTSIYQPLDKFYVKNYESSSDEEENDMSAEQIAQRRKRKLHQKYGPSLRVKLGRFTLLAEPFNYPQVIETSMFPKPSQPAVEVSQTSVGATTGNDSMASSPPELTPEPEPVYISSFFTDKRDFTDALDEKNRRRINMAWGSKLENSMFEMRPFELPRQFFD